MKINFKYLLAGLVLPVGFITFGTNQPVENKQLEQSLAKPYMVEVNSSTGTWISEYAGTSVQTDPFLIATELGAAPFKEDKFSAFPDIRMGIGSKITIYRAPEYRINDGKKHYILRGWEQTVGELFADNKLEIGRDDKINFSTDTELQTGMEITIIRVAVANIELSESIAFKVIEKEDKTLDKGKTKIQQAGSVGTRMLTYLARREDGVEVSRTLTKTTVTLEPVDQIKIIGTKPVITGWCKYNDLVLDASIKNGVDPNKICNLMHTESNGNVGSVSGGGHLGLFQYTEGFWADASAKAGYSGVSWDDAKAQIYTTAWAVTHGYASRWSGTFK